MDQQLDKIPAYSVSQPMPEQPHGSAIAYEQRPVIEANPVQEMISAQQPPMLPVTPIQQPVAIPVPQQPAPMVLHSAPAATSSQDDDLDTEWIEKAKAIVEQTKTDPYLQSRELSKVRADYLKVRHGKETKVAEE